MVSAPKQCLWNALSLNALDSSKMNQARTMHWSFWNGTPLAAHIEKQSQLGFQAAPGRMEFIWIHQVNS